MNLRERKGREEGGGIRRVEGRRWELMFRRSSLRISTAIMLRITRGRLNISEEGDDT